jgi:subtilisin family serine protease
MSLGSGEYAASCDTTGLSTYKAAIDKAVAAGITVLAASGNEGLCNAICSPACFSEVISVGAVWDGNFTPADNCVDVSTNSCLSLVDDASCSSGKSLTSPPGKTMEYDKVTYYSNSASFLDLLAPSHFAATPSATGNGTAAYNSSFGGTSAATPYAAGAAAVLQSAAKSKLGRYLTPHEVKMYLTEKGDALTDSKSSMTTPRVNLGNADAVLDNCGLGRDLPANTFLMTAPSCIPNPVDISSQYSELGTYNTNWRAWVWDAAPAAQNYVTNAAGDSLVPGVGNWLYSTNAATPLKLAAASGTFPATSSCSTYDATLLGECFVIDLTPAPDGSTDIWQIVGYPFTSPLAWADVRVAKSIDGGTNWTVYTPLEAENATPSLMWKTFWKYSGSASAYESYDDSTPNMLGTLQPQESFWVRIKSGSSGLGAGNFKLLIPKK